MHVVLRTERFVRHPLIAVEIEPSRSACGQLNASERAIRTCAPVAALLNGLSKRLAHLVISVIDKHPACRLRTGFIAFTAKHEFDQAIAVCMPRVITS